MAATMKGVIVPQAGGDYKIVDNIEKPKPGPHQILVKSLVTAINPVYAEYSSLSLSSFLISLANIFTVRALCKAQVRW